MDSAVNAGRALAQQMTIVNRKGLHARASARFVRTAECFDAEMKSMIQRYNTEKTSLEEEYKRQIFERQRKTELPTGLAVRPMSTDLRNLVQVSMRWRSRCRLALLHRGAPLACTPSLADSQCYLNIGGPHEQEQRYV